jgi:anti-sigma factor RsiW
MTCPPSEALVALIDGSLDAAARAELDAHAAACARCAGELARLRAGIAALRAGSPTAEPSPWFEARLEARLAEARASAPRPGLRRLLGLPGGTFAVAALAAVALVAAGASVAVVRSRHAAAARELAVAERAELYQDLEVVASLGDVDSAEDAAVVADLDALPAGRRP